MQPEHKEKIAKGVSKHMRGLSPEEFIRRMTPIWIGNQKAWDKLTPEQRIARAKIPTDAAALFTKGKSWRVINGKRIWLDKEAASKYPLSPKQEKKKLCERLHITLPVKCFFCSSLITKINPSHDSDSLIVHHINGDHGDNRVENITYAHRGCHGHYHNIGKHFKENPKTTEKKRGRRRSIESIIKQVNTRKIKKQTPEYRRSGKITSIKCVGARWKWSEDRIKKEIEKTEIKFFNEILPKPMRLYE